jgi:hypothetical protein
MLDYAAMRAIQVGYMGSNQERQDTVRKEKRRETKKGRLNRVYRVG